MKGLPQGLSPLQGLVPFSITFNPTISNCLWIVFVVSCTTKKTYVVLYHRSNSVNDLSYRLNSKNLFRTKVPKKNNNKKILENVFDDWKENIVVITENLCC